MVTQSSWPPLWLAAGLQRHLGIDDTKLAYLSWLYYLYLPALVCLLMPFVILLFLYMSLAWLYMWKWRHRLAESYSYSLWRGGIQTALGCWAAFGRLWHGYEVEGLRSLPSNQSALLVMYHGAFALDVFFLVAQIVVELDRLPLIVVDNFWSKIPGLSILLRVMHMSPGSVETCCQALRSGHIVLIMPGGVREALFADRYYSLMWGNRMGFARAAIGAQAAVYPVFTTNVREGICISQCGIGLFRRLYERTRLPIIVPFGYFPVKMRTYIDSPLLASDFDSAASLAAAVRRRLRLLIRRRQRLPGSVLLALLMRWRRLELALAPQQQQQQQQQQQLEASKEKSA